MRSEVSFYFRDIALYADHHRHSWLHMCDDSCFGFVHSVEIPLGCRRIVLLYVILGMETNLLILRSFDNESYFQEAILNELQTSSKILT